MFRATALGLLAGAGAMAAFATSGASSSVSPIGSELLNGRASSRNVLLGSDMTIYRGADADFVRSGLADCGVVAAAPIGG